MISIYKLLILITACILLAILPSTAQAAVFNVGSVTELQNALDSAQAGDEIIVSDGTYNGNFIINKNSGTSANPIVVRAENRHGAVLVGKSDLSNDDIGFDVHRQWWIIDGFELRDHTDSIRIRDSNAGNIEIRNNVIHDFHFNGIRVRYADNMNIHDNVIGFGLLDHPDLAWTIGAGIRILNSDNNIVKNNIVYSMSRDHSTCSVSLGDVGYAIYFGIGPDNNLIQGNLMMDADKGLFRVFSDYSEADNGENNTIQDNIFAFSEGGALGLSHTNVNYNKVTNNIFYSIYYATFGGKGNDPGYNEYRHNTNFITEFSLRGAQIVTKDDICSMNSIVKDNLFYADVPNNGSQWLYTVWNWTSCIKESDYNLFWGPGDPSRWIYPGRTFYGPNDIHDPAKRPLFIDEVGGDLTLASGSPGKNAGSDGADIGAHFNSDLKKEWMQNILAFPIQQKNAGGTTISFTTSPEHQYQVYAYIPETDPYIGIENFVIEGNIVPINLDNCINSPGSWGTRWIGVAPQRWTYLGTHANDGTLNIQWTHSNAAEKIFIRRLPTPHEAYSWISFTSNGPHNIPGRIEAEDYDIGGEGVAYHDSDLGNNGGFYRSDDVDIKLSNDSSDGGTGYAIGWMVTGEWLEYTIDVLSDADYTFYFRVLSQETTGQFHVEIDGVDIIGIQSVPYTGMWDTDSWITMQVSDVPLTAGQHIMQVFVDQNYFDLNYIEISMSTCSPADTNSDTVVSMTELMSYIADWKAGSVQMTQLMTAIGEWKNGCS